MCIIDFSLCVCVGDAFIGAVSGILHYLLLLSLGPYIIISSLRLVVTSWDLNSYFHPESQSFPIDTSEICMRLGMMFPSHASSFKAGKSSKNGLLY